MKPKARKLRGGVLVLVILVGIACMCYVGIFVAQGILFFYNHQAVVAEEALLSENSVWNDSGNQYSLFFSPTSDYGILQSSTNDWQLAVCFTIPGSMELKKMDDALSDIPCVADANWKWEEATDTITVWISDVQQQPYRDLEEKTIIFHRQF